jgi:hypothetical protein
MSDAMMIARVAFLAVHASAATVALVAAVVTLHTGRGFVTHRAAVVVMAACLGPTLTLGWSGFSGAARATFLGLAALALFMVGQAFRAGRVRTREIAAGGSVVLSARPGAKGVGPAFVSTLGFNAIALTVAGTVVPVLRVGGGTLGLVIAIGATVALGHVLVERRRSRVAAAVRSAAPAQASRLPAAA